MDKCLFCSIANGNGTKVFENDEMVIIKDIAPQAKLHYLAISKAHYDDIVDLATHNGDLLKNIFIVIAENADKLGLKEGFRIITNKGENGCQSVKHIHSHILGGEKLSEKMG